MTIYDDPAVFARGAVATTTAAGQVEVTNAGAKVVDIGTPVSTLVGRTPLGAGPPTR